MPRKPRFQLPGLPQHVVQRGNNRQACFFAESDYLYYLDAVRIAAERSSARVHGYVLTTNHVRLLTAPHDEYCRTGRTEAERPMAYRDRLCHQLDTGMIDQIRDVTNHALVVGTNRFKDEIEAMSRRRVRKRRPGKSRREAEGEY